MADYLSIFGGDLLGPSKTQYLSLSISVNTTLIWPLEQASSVNVAAAILDVDATAGSLEITMPDARQTSAGHSIAVNNIGSNTFTLLDAAGGTITAIASGEIWIVYLRDNSTEAGLWRIFEMGAGTSSATAGALAGLGLTAITTTLNQDMFYQFKNTPTYTVIASDRASLIEWSGTTSAINLTNSATLGTDWFFLLRNSGNNLLTVTPLGGSLINGAATLVFTPGQSAIICSDGTDFITIGLSAFQAASLTVAGVIELSTDTEAIAQASGSRAITPLNLVQVAGLYKRKTADETIDTDIGLSNDTDLSGYVLDADSHYIMEGELQFNTANATMGFAWLIQGTQNMQAGNLAVSLVGSGVPNTEVGDSQRQVTSAGWTAISIVPTGTTTETSCIIRGYLHTHATLTSTLFMAWAQSVSDGGNLILRKGSWLGFRKIK